MSAKIKTHRVSYKHYRPKGTKSRQFKQVYWPYLPIIAAICGLVWYGMGHGNFNYVVQYGVKGKQFDPQVAVLPITSGMAAIAVWSVLFAALGTLLIKHYRRIKRDIRKSENFIIHHPAMDIGLIVIVLLAVLISQTTAYNFSI